MVGIRDADESHNGSCDRRTGNTYLRSDRGNTTRTFWTDALLQGDVTDNRHQRVDHVACSYENRQEEGCQRSEECDTARMLTEKFLCNLDEPVHTTRGLHDTSTGYGCDDDVNYIGRRCARLESESEDKKGKTDTGNSSQGKATIA